ncbi:tuberoinfundibular peptide of 39 residues [Alligator mississippiensis]|uniref:tuberoinfundibular peptide of 39 residues n=1 Tax=Alligator mississippiensis TaxID=8496 RepID=UPI002877B6AA|nr:tuberoinfundibular peptide of 39 residues [Alligator mississippiensis]
MCGALMLHVPSGPAMEPAGKGLACVTTLLGCCLLLCSGVLLPPLPDPDSLPRLWKQDDTPVGTNIQPLPSALALQLPPIPLRGWSLQALLPSMRSPWEEEGQSRKSRLWNRPRQGVSPWRGVPAPGEGGKRSIVVADDAAFREKSKLLTAMERQKWLNAYMQKLLVVNQD